MAEVEGPDELTKLGQDPVVEDRNDGGQQSLGDLVDAEDVIDLVASGACELISGSGKEVIEKVSEVGGAVLEAVPEVGKAVVEGAAEVVGAVISTILDAQ
jgi:hypothetical protein